jgi:hypothetical protein
MPAHLDVLEDRTVPESGQPERDTGCVEHGQFLGFRCQIVDTQQAPNS